MTNVVQLNGPDMEQLKIDEMLRQISTLKQQLEDDKRKIIEDTKLSNELQILQPGS